MMFSLFLKICPVFLLLWEESFGTAENIIVTVIMDGSNHQDQTHLRFFNGTPYDENVIARRLWFDDVTAWFYSCDVDYARKLLYFYDGYSARIYVANDYDPDNLDYSGIETFHHGIPNSAYVKIAVDWISNNVYWVDEAHQWIVVQPGTNRDTYETLYRVIVDSDLERPTGLAVDPIHGYLFWSNIGNSTRIERSTLSGADRDQIITKGLVMPLGIAVDHSESRIYWVDYVRDTVESAGFGGENRNIISRRSHSNLYDIALYKNSIIVTDLDSEKVLFLSKATGETLRHFKHTDERFYGVAMFSDETQPSVSDQCQSLNCQDFCVGGGTSAAECVCRTGYKLQLDGRSCEEDFGEFHRAIVIASSTDICMLSIHSLSKSYRYLCLLHVASGIDSDNKLLFLDTDSNTRELIFATRYVVKIVQTDGQNFMTLTTTTKSITGLSLDWVDRNVYLSLEGTGGSSEGQIIVLSIQTEKLSPLFFGDPLIQPRNIIVDPHTRMLYWMSGVVGSTIIEKASLDGSGRSTVVTSGEMNLPSSLILDFVDQRLYWIDNGYIYRCGVDGSDLGHLDIDFSSFFVVPELILVYKGFLLWAEDFTFNSSRVHVLEKRDPFKKYHDFTSSYTGQIKIIKYMDPVLQKPEPGPCQLFNGGCEHICLPNGQVGECQCEFGFNLAEDGKSCLSTTFVDNFILLTDWTHSKIYQISLSNDTTVGLRSKTTRSPVGVTFDLQTDQVIWGDTGDQAIRRMFLNGSMEEVLIDTDFFHDAHPDRFAIDYASGNIYYTSVPVRSGGFVGVGVLTRDGKHKKIITFGDNPRAIVLDLHEGLMFWSDHGLQEVYRAKMDGTNWQTLRVSSDLTWPNGIAIDYQDKQIYVTDGYTNNIFRCSYTGPCDLVYSDLNAWLMSIFLSGGYLYYTSWNNPFITRIDKATFTEKIRISNNPEHGRLDDIFVYNSSEPSPPVHTICSQNNGRGPCSTFCLPSGDTSYTCACEDNVEMTSDGLRCENVQLTTTSTTISTSTAISSTTRTTTTTVAATTAAPPDDDVQLTTTSTTISTSTAISSTTRTTTTTVAATTVSQQDDDGNMAVIIGGSVGGLVLVLVVVVVIVMVCRRQNNEARHPESARLRDTENTGSRQEELSLYDCIPADNTKPTGFQDNNQAPALPGRQNSYVSHTTNPAFSGYESLSPFTRDQAINRSATATMQHTSQWSMEDSKSTFNQRQNESAPYIEFTGSRPDTASDYLEPGSRDDNFPVLQISNPASYGEVPPGSVKHGTYMNDGRDSSYLSPI